MYNYAFDAETKRWIDEVAAKLPAFIAHAAGIKRGRRAQPDLPLAELYVGMHLCKM